MPARIVVTEFVSLDGVMEAPGGEPGFKYPGWSFEFDGELQVPGSHRLVQELIESDLVDQLNLMVFPVILGTGKKAFEETPERRKLRLRESRVVGDGVLVLVYERAA